MGKSNNKSMDITKIIKDNNYTKKELVLAIGTSRPTLDRSIAKFEETGKCSYMELMILFSRLSDYDQITIDIIEAELTNSKKAIVYLDNVIKDLCNNETYIELPEMEVNEVSDKSLLLEHINELEAGPIGNPLEGISCKYCGAESSLREKGPNGKIICFACKREFELNEIVLEQDEPNYSENEGEAITNKKLNIGDIVNCTVKKISDYGLKVSFKNKEGFILYDNLSKEIKDSVLHLGQRFKAKLTRVDGWKHHLSMKGLKRLS